MKLARRSVSSKCLPREGQLQQIHSLESKKAIALPIEDFLSRLKLGAKFNHACKVRAEREQKGKKNAGLSLEVITNKNKEEYGRLARSYIIHVFNETQGHFNLTSDIVHGLGSFDLESLLSGPTEYSLGCFKQLFNTFLLREYFKQEQEAQCLEEYTSFVDELRQVYSDMAQPTLLITDTINFLMEQSSLLSRPLLYRLFTLSCLCLDQPFQDLPEVRFRSVRTDVPSSKLTDIILPVQSYFKSVPRGVETLSDDSSVSKFLSLETTFGDSALRDSYDPWLSIDLFGRAGILAKLDPNAITPQEQAKAAEPEVSQSCSPQKNLAVPRGKKRSSKLLRRLSLHAQRKNCVLALVINFNCTICTIVFSLSLC